MDNVKYKLLQYATIGWEVTHSNLTKEECTAIINSNIAEGINPNYMKVQIDTDTPN